MSYRARSCGTGGLGGLAGAPPSVADLVGLAGLALPDKSSAKNSLTSCAQTGGEDGDYWMVVGTCV